MKILKNKTAISGTFEKLDNLDFQKVEAPPAIMKPDFPPKVRNAFEPMINYPMAPRFKPDRKIRLNSALI